MQVGVLKLQRRARILREKFGDELADDRFREIDEKKELYYREAFRHTFLPMDGAAELVNALAEEGALLGIGSSGPPANVALAVEMQPENVAYLYEYGKTLIEVNDIDGAVRIADRAIEVDPRDVRGYALKANALA